MKKLTLFFLSLLALSLGFQACDDSKTYAEMLEEEKDGINDFIKKTDFKISHNRSFMHRTLRQSLRKKETAWMSLCSLPVEYICRL